jgi:hypothetical protein
VKRALRMPVLLSRISINITAFLDLLLVYYSIIRLDTGSVSIIRRQGRHLELCAT